jgi:glycosyltransferase 2 family protein
MKRPLKLTIQILVSGGVIAFLLWQIDLEQTVDILRESDWSYVTASFLVVLATTLLMAWRWGMLLAARGVHEPYRWLVEMYFIGNAAGQVLPTAIGGDAVRIIEHARRRPDARATAAGAVVMERILGMVITLLLVAVALAVAAGRYEGVRLLVIVELVCVTGVLVLGILLFSPRLGNHLERRLFPLGRRIGLEKPLVSLYRTMHEYRHTPGALLAVLGITLVAQTARIFSIWLCGEAVGIDVSVAAYVILGPLLFFVQMVPFTLNGLGVREAFFVGFLGRFGVDAESALAVGLLYFGTSIAAALPGGLILLWRSIRPTVVRPGEP